MKILAFLLTMLCAMPAQAGCVAFYGDSMLTAEPDGGDSIQTKLAALRPDLTVVDQAVPGTSTQWLVDNANATMQQHPTCLYVILAGTNDPFYGETDPDQTAKRLRTLGARARTHAAGELILTPLPVGCGSPANEFMRDVGNQLYWRNGSGATYNVRDPWPPLAVPGWAYFNGDCVHLNNAGRQIMAEFLAEVIP